MGHQQGLDPLTQFDVPATSLFEIGGALSGRQL
jgi:hypothetical protein